MKEGGYAKTGAGSIKKRHRESGLFVKRHTPERVGPFGERKDGRSINIAETYAAETGKSGKKLRKKPGGSVTMIYCLVRTAKASRKRVLKRKGKLSLGISREKADIRRPY